MVCGIISDLQQCGYARMLGLVCHKSKKFKNVASKEDKDKTFRV